MFVHTAVSKLCKSRGLGFTGRSESDFKRPNDIFRILRDRAISVVTSFLVIPHEHFGLLARDLLLNGDLVCGCVWPLNEHGYCEDRYANSVFALIQSASQLLFGPRRGRGF